MQLYIYNQVWLAVNRRTVANFLRSVSAKNWQSWIASDRVLIKL